MRSVVVAFIHFEYKNLKFLSGKKNKNKTSTEQNKINNENIFPTEVFRVYLVHKDLCVVNKNKKTQTDLYFGVSDSGGGLVAKSCLSLVTPWTVPHQAPLSTEFSRQEYWSG